MLVLKKNLKLAVTETREFANSLIRQKKQQMLKNPAGTSSKEAEDLLSRFLISGHVDEKFVADIIISFMLAGRDTTSSALTWFFWLLNKNIPPQDEIVKEIDKTHNSSIYQEVKDMNYTHAALCEGDEEKWKFVPRDPYSYPVFQAGPRVCLGRDMALLQMKRVVAGVLARFRVVPLIDEGIEPVYLPYLTAKMKGGLPVRIEERALTR
ncbi:cytochrome P450 94A2-like [Silene latifolia]|uniref:cytochrome P450 94A2-like n=1 Tax=Silene latifolia TaxID=37657 RepID=UPI003D786BFA